MLASLLFLAFSTLFFFFSMLRQAARALSRRAENLVSIGRYIERGERESNREREERACDDDGGPGGRPQSHFAHPFSSSSSSSNPPLHASAAGHAVSLFDLCLGEQRGVVRRELIGVLNWGKSIISSERARRLAHPFPIPLSLPLNNSHRTPPRRRASRAGTPRRCSPRGRRPTRSTPSTRT